MTITYFLTNGECSYGTRRWSADAESFLLLTL